jgi:integrase/recombinase XerD
MAPHLLPAVIEQPADRKPVPTLVQDAGGAAVFVWEEYFFAQIRNPHTRRAYRHAVREFLAWCDRGNLTLKMITPGLVGQYFDQHPAGIPTRKQHLAALRGFFDKLVLRHVVAINPAASVRGERYEVIEGKTPEISRGQVKRLLKSFDTGNVIGLRDRAIVATLIFTAARIGAVAGLKIGSFTKDGDSLSLRFMEKGGKDREIPVRRDLERYMSAYVKVGELTDAVKDTPLFRSTTARSKRLNSRGMSTGDMGHMLKRRLKDAGLPDHLSPHSFRVATITDLLGQGIPLEDVQFLAGHADPRTTRLYDRRQKKVTRHIVDQISLAIPLDD